LNLLLGPDDSLFGIPINANAGVAGTEDQRESQKDDVFHAFFLARQGRIAT
jgi:hypothetical protein